jgi:hypothetical protein
VIERNVAIAQSLSSFCGTIATSSFSSLLPTNLASICSLLNVIGNLYLMKANIPAMMDCFVEAAREAAMIYASDGSDNVNIPIIMAGHAFCHLSQTHPGCAPAA